MGKSSLSGMIVGLSLEHKLMGLSPCVRLQKQEIWRLVRLSACEADGRLSEREWQGLYGVWRCASDCCEGWTMKTREIRESIMSSMSSIDLGN